MRLVDNQNNVDTPLLSFALLLHQLPVTGLIYQFVVVERLMSPLGAG
jgi:hypothetical protein